MNTTQQTRKSVGRPSGKDNDQVRAQLLDAARHHFIQSEFKAVSVRQIAATAGVNGAMVSYYFGNKLGLYLAMVRELLASLEASFGELGDSQELTLEDFSRNYTRILADNPWWPNFMVREVLFSEGETRDAVIALFAESFASRLLGKINQEIASGNYRDDLNPALTMVSLMGMTVFPFIAKPIMQRVLNVELDGSAVEMVAQHNIALFHHGVLKQTEEVAG